MCLTSWRGHPGAAGAERGTPHRSSDPAVTGAGARRRRRLDRRHRRRRPAARRHRRAHRRASGSAPRCGVGLREAVADGAPTSSRSATPTASTTRPSVATLVRPDRARRRRLRRRQPVRRRDPLDATAPPRRQPRAHASPCASLTGLPDHRRAERLPRAVARRRARRPRSRTTSTTRRCSRSSCSARGSATPRCRSRTRSARRATRSCKLVPYLRQVVPAVWREWRCARGHRRERRTSPRAHPRMVGGAPPGHDDVRAARHAWSAEPRRAASAWSCAAWAWARASRAGVPHAAARARCRSTPSCSRTAGAWRWTA